MRNTLASVVALLSCMAASAYGQGTIIGTKYEDINGNGVQDSGEPGVAGWTIRLQDPIGNVQTAVTDGAGQYLFSNLMPNPYSVSEEFQPCWTLTGPFQIMLSNPPFARFDFPNRRTSPCPTPPPPGACVAPPPQMRTWWTFDEGSGTVAHDIAGAVDSSGTIIGGPTPVSGMAAGTYRFDGLKQFIEVPHSAELNFGTGDLTIDAWVRTSARGTMAIVDKRSFAQIGYTLFLENGRVGFQMGDRAIATVCGGNNQTTPCTNYYGPVTSLANDGAWHHVAVTVDRDQPNGGTLYLDGQIIHVFDPTIRPLSLDTTVPLWIARHHGNLSISSDDFYIGDIDEVEMFDRALTSAEIQSIVNASSGGKCKITVAPPGTIAGTKFNDLDGDGVRDPNDPPLGGWTIVITDGNGHAFATTTDAAGQYTFVVPGQTYVVSEVQQPGWVRTLPATGTGTYTVVLPSGGTFQGIDFGNRYDVCTPPPSGMRAWWPLDETSGGTAHDREGSDDAGAWIGSPAPVAGKVAGALSFDGSTQYVSVADSPELDVGTRDLTIDAWVKTTGSAIQAIVDKRASNTIGYAFFLFDGRIGFQMGDRPLSPFCSNDNSNTACTNFIASPSSLLVNDGQWHHVAVTVDRDQPNGGSLYVDGAVQDVFDSTIRPLSLDNGAPLSIGRRHPTSAASTELFFDGEIDEVELFDRALSPPEVEALFTAGAAGKCKGGGKPGFIQSDYFTRGNFEVVVPGDRGLVHYWRDNDAPGFPWHGATAFGSARYASAALIQSNFGRNFEVVAGGGGTLAHSWRDNGDPVLPWYGPYVFAFNVRGTPSLIQSDFGVKGDFDVVVPQATGGIAHYRRDNDDPNLVWHGPIVFAASEGLVDDAALIQSNFGGNFEVVARIGDRLAHFWRDAGLAWHGPVYFAGGVSGAPSLIQSSFGVRGNFEVVAPLASGGIGHWWRDNDDPSLPWHGPTVFASGRIDSVTLIQSNFGMNFEVVAQRGTSYEHYWRESAAPLAWYGSGQFIP